MPIAALIARIAQAVSRATGPVLSKLAKVANTKATKEAIMKAVRDNPLTAVLLAVELFGALDKDVQSVASSNPEAAALVNAAATAIESPAYKADELTEDDLSRIKELDARYDDEMDLLDRCAAILGGRERMTIVLNAANLPVNVRRLHAHKRGYGFEG